jgi:integrase
MKLSDSKVRNLKAKSRQYKVYDSHGLFLIVSPKGGKWWRYRFKQNGKEKTLSLGIYDPGNVRKHVSLAEARTARDEMAQRLKDGRSLRTKNDTDQATFKSAMLEWLSRRTKWSEETHHQNKSRLDSYVVPYLGDRKLTDIDTGDVLQVLRRIEATGKLATMSEVKSLISRVLGYAVAIGELKHNPSSDIGEDALSAYKAKHFARLTDVHEIAGLVRAVDGYKGTFVTRLALKWSMLTFARPGEIRQAEWSEIEGETWRIPDHKMKAPREHIIPLSPQAIKVLNELRPLTGRGKYLFPGARSAKRPMSENTVNSALRRMDYDKDQMTAHGFRGMASGQLHEMGWDSLVIELQLAHTDKNQVRAAYNASERLEERRKMMKAWADRLDNLGSNQGSNVVGIRA